MMNESMFGYSMGGGHLLWMFVISIVVVIPVWRICQRTGYSGWLGLLVLVPLANLLLLYFLAFADWPVNTKVAQKSNDS